MDALIGAAAVPVASAATSIPWDSARTVELIALPEAVTKALEFSREVKSAEERLNQADSLTGQALGSLGPNLSYRRASGTETSAPSSVTDASTGKPKVRDEHWRADESWTLRQPIFDPGSFSEWRRRGLVKDSRQSALSGTRGDEYLATVQAFVNLGAARLSASFAKEYEQQLGDLLAYIGQRAEAGAATDADMQRVRARTLTARASRIEQEGLQEAAVVEFSRLTNIVPKKLQLPRFEELRVAVPENISAALIEGMNSNPEVAGARADFEAADWDKVGAKAKFGPRVDFEYSDSSVINAGGPVGLQHDKRAMVVISWVLAAGGSDYHYHQERGARYEEMRWRLDDQRRRLTQVLSALYAQLGATRARLAAGYKELAAITEASRAMGERMLAGNTSLLDYLDVLERLYQTRIRLVSLHGQELMAGAQIGRSLGQADRFANDEAVQENRTKP